MLKLQHIEMLLAIERAGSIRAASKALGRTQPAVTKALRQAEGELGAAIFKRAPSGVAVTEEGESILRRARVIQAELRKMQEEIDLRRGAGKPRLSVTVSPLAAAKIIPAAVRRFRRRYPGALLQINGGHEPMAFGPVRDGTVDLVIGPAPQASDAVGLSVEILMATPVLVITGKRSRWSGVRELQDLVEADWLMIGTRNRQPIFQRTFTALGLPPPVPVACSDSILSVLSMVQNSDFVCSFPGALFDEFAAKWEVQALSIDPPLPDAKIAITMAVDRPLTPATQYFCDCVSATVTEPT